MNGLLKVCVIICIVIVGSCCCCGCDDSSQGATAIKGAKEVPKGYACPSCGAKGVKGGTCPDCNLKYEKKK